MLEPSKALYIHIPFCASRCFYCDFETDAIGEDDPAISEYVEGVVEDVFRLGREGALSHVETVYIGGGTPSCIGSKHLSSILYSIGLSMNITPDMEVTVECNPDSFDRRLSADLFALGANRLSFGIQSFNDEELKAIGRRHDSEQAERAIRDAQERFENISVDLMCGLPGQTAGSFRKSLEKAISLGVKHISVYPLTVEEGTPMQGLVRDGAVQLPGEDEVAGMMELAHQALTSEGFDHYEVSNFARPGHRSRHNMAYWKGLPYIGIGRGAVGMEQGEGCRIRRKNGLVVDSISADQALCEDLMLAMRTADGVSVDIIDVLDESVFPGISSKFGDFVMDGLVRKETESYVPTLKGFLLGNEIYQSLLDYFG